MADEPKKGKKLQENLDVEIVKAPTPSPEILEHLDSLLWVPRERVKPKRIKKEDRDRFTPVQDLEPIVTNMPKAELLSWDSQTIALSKMEPGQQLECSDGGFYRVALVPTDDGGELVVEVDGLE